MTSQRRPAGVRARMLVLALGLAAAGCATGGRAFETGASRDVEVTIENQNYKDAVVYAIWDAGPRGRLGMVTGNTTQTFATALRGHGEMRVEVDFIAGSNVVTESIGVFEGEQLHVVIPPSL